MESTGKGRALRIVVVEDHDDGREMLKMMLELAGHLVVAAADGQTGLVLIQTLDPDVALVDIGLPKLDGYEIARQLTEVERAPRTLLIAMSGYGTAEHKRKSLAAGFRDHLVKPIDPPELERKLNELASLLEPE